MTEKFLKLLRVLLRWGRKSSFEIYALQVLCSMYSIGTYAININTWRHYSSEVTNLWKNVGTIQVGVLFDAGSYHLV